MSTFAVLLLSSSPWAHPFLNVWETQIGLHIGSLEFARSLGGWINDGLMMLFFFLVALEYGDGDRHGLCHRLPGAAWIGFTMALFIANRAFSESLVDSAKLGIFLASVVSAVAGLVLLRSLPPRATYAGTDRY